MSMLLLVFYEENGSMMFFFDRELKPSTSKHIAVYYGNF